VNADLWRERRVLVTGHTGFKGAWLSLWLERLGARTFGLALPPPAGGAYHALGPAVEEQQLGDIRDRELVAAAVQRWRPEVVFHLAAQATVPEGYRDPIGTFATNVTGTINVVAAAAATPPGAVVAVTSDKVYRNDESGRPYTEADDLGGPDPYSASKACADIAARSWRSLPDSSGTAIAVARAGNVIGGGDVAPDRLLPDARLALRAGAALELRNPDAVRPWQFVLEPLSGYLLLAERLVTSPADSPAAVNFGPTLDSCRSVSEVIELAHRLYGAGSWSAQPSAIPAEAKLLRLDVSLADEALGWRPRLTLEQAVEWCVSWWRAEDRGESLRDLALQQILDFTAAS
jgi:CDP-glucose 4,6-dehydratase